MATFREGQRVRHTGRFFLTGVPENATGTVALVAGANGESIYPDPARRMVFVSWDNSLPKAVFRNELEPIK